ncbi:histidine phosphatase superfamily [Pelagophyceae sp. CCMP2097]|nr:histidine phosphatase superfamily [Pelagophyceae sp. CCMP2097]
MSMDRNVVVAAVAALALGLALRLLRRGAPPPDRGGSLGVVALRQTIVLVRHGDRFDYADPSWLPLIRAKGGKERDPPLSTLGHRQARELGAALAEFLAGRIVRVASSPYLRCLQTIRPLAHDLGVPIDVDEALAEIEHHASNTATTDERFVTFPEVRNAADGSPTCLEAPREGWPVEYMERLRNFAADLDRRFGAPDAEETLVLVSHAASVALVSALLDQELTPENRFAPAGMYVLGRDSVAEPWKLLRAGDNNAPYVSTNAATTFPWGFKQEYLDAWTAKHRAAFPASQLKVVNFSFS